MSTQFVEARPLPLDEAILWTTEWRNANSHHLKAESFLFNADDFRAILNEDNGRIPHVRFYIALKPDDDGKMEEKLICVAVDERGFDILNPMMTNGKSGVYDFSHPCPPLCRDLESPLAGGEAAKIKEKLK